MWNLRVIIKTYSTQRRFLSRFMYAEQVVTTQEGGRDNNPNFSPSSRVVNHTLKDVFWENIIECKETWFIWPNDPLFKHPVSQRRLKVFKPIVDIYWEL